MLKIIECKTRRELRAFMALPGAIYSDAHGRAHYVRPVPACDASIGHPRRNPLLSNGPHLFLLAVDGDTPVMRVLTGSDRVFCRATGLRQGYISLFEAYDRPEAAALLFQCVAHYQRMLKNNIVVGPNPPDGFGFGYGVLTQGFDATPSLFNAYNAPYYERLLLQNGFIPYVDHYGYRFLPEQMNALRYREVARWAEGRFGIDVECVDLRAFARACRDIYAVISDKPATAAIEDVAAQMRVMRPYYRKEFFLLARVKGEPAGFLLALPDGTVARPAGRKALLATRIDIPGLRIVTLHVNARFRGSAVTAALFGRLMDAVRKFDIQNICASTVRMDNVSSIYSAQRAGFAVDRVYRQYQWLEK